MIDWGFIGELEGGQHLVGYVPDPEAGGSGVTIATGIDLGRYGPADLLPLPTLLQDRLRPYVGLRGAVAQTALTRKQLILTQNQADAMDAAEQARRPLPLETAWSEAQTGVAFKDLPDAAQTVMMSVTYQYGTPWVRCPRFWAACVALDWPGVIAELEAFGDRYPTRRQREADYLKATLS